MEIAQVSHVLTFSANLTNLSPNPVVFWSLYEETQEELVQRMKLSETSFRVVLFFPKKFTSPLSPRAPNTLEGEPLQRLSSVGGEWWREGGVGAQVQGAVRSVALNRH